MIHLDRNLYLQIFLNMVTTNCTHPNVCIHQSHFPCQLPHANRRHRIKRKKKKRGRESHLTSPIKPRHTHQYIHTKPISNLPKLWQISQKPMLASPQQNGAGVFLSQLTQKTMQSYTVMGDQCLLDTLISH